MDTTLPTRLEDLFYMDNIPIEHRNKNWNKYMFNSKGVPRVTSIIKGCISKDYLLSWAAKLGYRSYISEMNKASVIGTKTHTRIEHYLTTGNDLPVENDIMPVYMSNVLTAYENFKSWLDRLKNRGYNLDVLFIEKPVVCEYYGGTIDCIAAINGANYILDFKTSKKISYEYILQVCAYMIIVNSGYCPDIPHIDGIGIIRIDKDEKGKFEDLFLNSFIPYQSTLLQSYMKAFMSLLSSYYHLTNVKCMFSEYKKIYDFVETISSTVEGES